MSDEKVIEYDHGNVLSFVGSPETMCGLFGGFVFAGTTVILGTVAESPLLLTQVILFILSTSMGMFIGALWELHYMNISVCLQSPKLIIPNYPARWRVINTYITAGSFLEEFSINLMFLLKNMRELFALNMCISVLFFTFMYFRRWKPLKDKMDLDIKERSEKDAAKRK